jgi:hypothetical protein
MRRARVLLISLCCLVVVNDIDAAERSFNDSAVFESAEGMTILVDVAKLDVELRAANTDIVEVHTELRISSVGAERAERWIEAHKPRFTATDGRLEIIAEPGKSGFLGFGHLTARARLRITAPSTAVPDLTTTSGTIRVKGRFPEAKPLRLRTGTGFIDLEGGAGSLDIRTPSGEVLVQVTSPVDRFFARTASGSITLSGGANAATVETASGNVWLGNLAGSARVESSNGRISLQWDHLGDDDIVQVRSASGAVRLTVPPGIEPRGTITTMGGTIRCAVSATLDGRSDSLRLEGDGPSFEVETASGGVTVDLGDD